MSKKREFQVDTINVPTEYDLNIYKFRRAFDKIKKCPHCYSSVNLCVDYYRSNIYPALHETFMQKIRRVFFHKITHVIICHCYRCGTKYSATFYTDKNCIDMYDEFKRLVDQENEEAKASYETYINNGGDDNDNLGSSRWVFNLRIGGKPL